jgi:prepilin-type N-terminal cleavage/methylation domain-containing protein
MKKGTVIKHAKGFTLIELTISSILIALVIMAIYTALSTGMKIWAKTNETVIDKEQAILAADRLSKELRNSIPFLLIGYEFKEAQISFPLLVTGSLTEDETPIENSSLPAKITYLYDAEKTAIIRQQEILGKDKKPTIKEIANGIKSIKFFYRFYDSERSKWDWNEKWEQQIKPGAVKIEIVLQGKKDAPEETIQRVISMPQ